MIAKVPIIAPMVHSRPDLDQMHPKNLIQLIQKVCLWILEKLHYPQFNENINIKEIEINFLLIESLIQQESHIMNSIMMNHCKAILLGNNQMKEIHLPGYTFLYLFHFPHNYPNNSFVGLPIVIVPWMNGVFCIE